MDFISDNSLLDVGFSGPNFSWCNGQRGQARRWARLDRCLVNANWTNNYNAQILYHLPRVSSDHSPLLLVASNNALLNRKVFRFENFWFENADCLYVIHKALCFRPHSSPMHAFAHLLAHVKMEIKSWKTSWGGGGGGG